MSKIDRARRAEIRILAAKIRHRGELAGWDTSRIAAAILSAIADVRQLEAWRLAHGWSRMDVIDDIAGLYRQAQLRAPAINSSMLCRWEHGHSVPSAEYAAALCRIYQVSHEQLGLPAPALPGTSASGAFSAPFGAPTAPPALARPASVIQGRESRHRPRTSKAGQCGGLPAVRESAQLAIEAEGPGGGPMTVVQLHRAVRYYDLNYGTFPPRLLADEVRGCRAVITGMLGHDQPAAMRRTVLLLGAWFSALLGSLAFDVADYPGAEIHLSAAAGLAASSDSRRLLGWVLAAQSVLVGVQGRPLHALGLAAQAVHHADTPLRRAQALTWAQLPALVQLDRGDNARETMADAEREMAASPVRGKAGRFGFDRAEFKLHLAEAAWGLGDFGAAREHAEESLRYTTPGRPDWAAATLALARGNAVADCPDHGAALALRVLDTISAEMLRSSDWRQLAELDKQLAAEHAASPLAAELHERLLAMGPDQLARALIVIPPAILAPCPVPARGRT